MKCGNRDISQTGASTLLPGLVLLADRGKGIKVGDAPLFPDLGRSNLAAQVNSVSYALADDCPLYGSCRTSIVAHMLVPTGLLLPEVYIDHAFGIVCGATPPHAAYLEVGHTLQETTEQDLWSGWGSLGINPFVNIMAVLVNGQAPDVLTDSNADGVVDEKDLLHKGYMLLSNPVMIRVEMEFQEYDFMSFHSFDLDGNGQYYCGVTLPSGSTTRTPPPR